MLCLVASGGLGAAPGCVLRIGCCVWLRPEVRCCAWLRPEDWVLRLVAS